MARDINIKSGIWHEFAPWDLSKAHILVSTPGCPAACWGHWTDALPKFAAKWTCRTCGVLERTLRGLKGFSRCCKYTPLRKRLSKLSENSVTWTTVIWWIGSRNTPLTGWSRTSDNGAPSSWHVEDSESFALSPLCHKCFNSFCEWIWLYPYVVLTPPYDGILLTFDARVAIVEILNLKDLKRCFIQNWPCPREVHACLQEVR